MKLDVNINATLQFASLEDIEALKRMLAHLVHLEKKSMASFDEFVEQMTLFSSRQETAVSGLSADLQRLADQIAELQGMAGNLTPEQEAKLSDILATRQSAVESLEAMEALNPPQLPVDPPIEPPVF